MNAAQKAVDEFNKPESYAKGEAFEDYICRKIFPDEKYQLLHRTQDYNVNKERFVDDSKQPDLKFRSKINKKEFFVEAKFRSTYNQDCIEWCRFSQLKRYQGIDKQTPVFIMLGVGEDSTSPNQVFLIPMKEIKYTKLYKSFLKKYELTSGQPVDYRTLQL